jgi:hypothetical protein
MQVNPTAFGPVYKGSEIGSAVTILWWQVADVREV